MEWGSKAALWDFSELGRNSGGGHRERNGLAEAVQAAPFGRVVKRAKASGVGGAGSQKAVATCAVDGCGSDLSGCREYHRRHKVCEEHAKMPVVMVGGKQQRFCQQCSRFQLLAEFDEGKRSCRKRLDCHNRRRRKPQAALVYSCGGLLSGSHQGQGFAAHADAPQAARTRPGWGSLGQGNEDGPCFKFGSYNPTNEKGGSPVPYPHLQHEREQMFPFSQNNGTAITTDAAASETSAAPSSSSSKLFPHQMNFLNPIRAPSLLSSTSSLPPPTMQDPSLLVPHVVPVAAPNAVPWPTFQLPPQSLPGMGSLGKCAGLQDQGAVSLTGLSCLDAESNEATTILVPDAGSSDFSSMPIFDAAGTDGSSDGASQDIPFYWH